MTKAPETAMRYIFAGGPGRSGTSFIADRLGAHPQIASLKDIELKIFSEKNGLIDLFHALCQTYSPNRANVAIDQFRRMAEALAAGRFGQLPLGLPPADWNDAIANFVADLSREGHPVPQDPEDFLSAARRLLARIAALAAELRGSAGGTPEVFLEKTPHNLLAIGFLARLAPGARFLHVMRDPRSIAWSLLAMRWGPNELSTAARWVDSYCLSWVRTEALAASMGLPLIRLHIEEATAAPADAAAWLTERLDLAPYPGLLCGADANLLNRWTAKASASERAWLDDRLGAWAAHFGYDRDCIG